VRRRTAWLLAIPLLAGCSKQIGSEATAPSPDTQRSTDAANADLVALNESHLAMFTPASRRAFLSDDSPYLLVPIASIAPDFDPAAITPASLVTIGREPAQTPGAWLNARQWIRVEPGDPRSVLSFLLIPRAMIQDLSSIPFGDRAVEIVRFTPDIAPSPEPSILPAAFARFRPALEDASLRWRARMALRSFGIDASSMSVFEDEAVEAFATTLELRARAALAELGETDGTLADKIERTLGRTLVFPKGVIAPAWGEADAPLDDLFNVVLDPTVPRGAAADRAQQWLDAQPRALAWIADDYTYFGTRVLIAELAGTPDLVAARVAPSASCDPATLHPLLMRSVTEIDLRCRERPADRTFRIDVGAWSASLDAIAAPRAINPPGVRIGPLMLPHTMRSLLAAQITLPDAAYATAALVQRKPSSDEWQVYAECLDGSGGAAQDRSDTLRICFGSRDMPRVTLELHPAEPSTRISYDAAGNEQRSAIDAVIRREADRWVAFVDIPSDAFEPDGTLVLGAERVDARGVRSVWPRPVLPWESNPPRIAVDPATWRRIRASN
jgi:hypothetical protein